MPGLLSKRFHIQELYAGAELHHHVYKHFVKKEKISSHVDISLATLGSTLIKYILHLSFTCYQF